MLFVDFVSDLPIELRIRILTLLDFADLLRACLVSRSFQCIIDHPFVWKSSFLSGKNVSVLFYHRSLIKSYGGRVRKPSVDYSKEFVCYAAESGGAKIDFGYKLKWGGFPSSDSMTESLNHKDFKNVFPHQCLIDERDQFSSSDLKGWKMMCHLKEDFDDIMSALNFAKDVIRNTSEGFNRWSSPKLVKFLDSGGNLQSWTGFPIAPDLYAVVLVRSGVYFENISIRNMSNLLLKGIGHAPVHIEGKDLRTPAILVEPQNVEKDDQYSRLGVIIQGFSVFQANLLTPNINISCIVLLGNSNLVGCKVVSSTGLAVLIKVSYPAHFVTVTDCELSGLSGITIYRSLNNVYIENNLIHNIKFWGIACVANSSPIIRKNIFQNITSKALFLLEESDCYFEGNKIANTNEWGIVMNGCKPSVRILNNRIASSLCGILLYESARGVIIGNDISNCREVGISLMSGSEAIMEENVIHQNRWGLYFDNCGGYLSSNVICDNSETGIIVACKANPFIFNNRILNTKGSGVTVLSESDITFKQNIVHDNIGAICYMSEKSSVIKDNILERNEHQEEGIRECVAEQKCTYSYSGPMYKAQWWFNCITCSKILSDGVCVSCAKICHSGHELSKAKFSLFFCDCGALETGYRCCKLKQ